MTFSFLPLTDAGAQTPSEQQITGNEPQQLVSRPMHLVEALSDMSEHAVSEFLITCAEAVNTAAKRNDMEAVHALVHAEAAALIELHARWDYFGTMGDLHRQRMEGRVA